MATPEPTLAEIKAIALDMRDKICQLQSIMSGAPNCCVMEPPLKINDTTTKVNVRFDPPLDGFKYGNLLCNKIGLDLSSIDVGDELLFTGHPKVREYKGKEYCDVWVSTCKLVHKGNGVAPTKRAKAEPERDEPEDEDNLNF